MTAPAPTGRRSDLATRTVIGILLIGVAVAAMKLGGFAFWLLAVCVAIGMAGEWARLFGADRKATRLLQFALSVPLAIMSPLAAGPDFFALGLLFGAAFFVVIISRHVALAAGVLYAGLPALALVLVRHQHDGFLLTLWMLALVWACDVGAYFAGRTIGGPRLAPTISPNKTWAGLAGGVTCAGIFGFAMHGWFGLPLRLTLATPLLAVLAQGGDLFESGLKRRAGVKDSGTILPGHGGLLDRLDGLVPVAPLAACLVMLPEIRSLAGL